MAASDLSVYGNTINCYKMLFCNENRKDVTFKFKGSKTKLTAHKLILETVSPVFQSMFSGNFVEDSEVTIDDISPEVFKLLLSGIYLKDIHSQILNDNPITLYADLYYAAEKYDIEDIRLICKKYLIENCHNGNTTFLLSKAKIFNLPDLEATCKTYFEKNTYSVLQTQLGLHTTDEIFSELLSLENVIIAREYDLYIAIEAIYDNRCLTKYSKCLSMIRFLTMEISEVLACRLLSDKDKVAVITNIEAKNRNEISEIPMPSHLSHQTQTRVNRYHHQSQSQAYFWTKLMLVVPDYQKYLNRFIKIWKFSIHKKSEIEFYINEGRNDLKVDGSITQNTVILTQEKLFKSPYLFYY
ncbi:BTB/POZ domain-containing protein 2-like [Culicoides brevitarsis]|uniref:BTB/POZ domain-containing protein 2-like n=1 Tax=Culicoides brevitarsis TaxID=469753 RepID=UPI00307C03DD